MKKLIQIGPRIQEHVYQALHAYSDGSRMSMSLIVELALQEYLKTERILPDDNRD